MIDRDSTPPPAAAPSSRSFAFPLNVYARLIELAEGRVDYLHYGLFESSKETVGTAQERSTALLRAHLPPPCRLLEVGVGLGTTLARLTADGYEALGITPDAAQIAYLQARHGATVVTRCHRLEDFHEKPGQWDVLLFQESAQYIELLDLFVQADRLLGPTGEIVVLDEFALRRDGPGRENLHLLSHFIALAERFGFVLHESIDVSGAAAPTLDYLLSTTDRYRAELERDLAVTSAELDSLCVSNIRYRDHYAQGQYGYFLLRLRRGAPPRWLPCRIDATNAQRMCDLFHEVFGQPMSPAHWEWKYGNGRGFGVGVAAAGANKLVAHYGGIARPLLQFGRPVLGAQSCDVMVATAGRGSLARQGPLFVAATTYLENQLGYGSPCLLGFGFPSAVAWKLPARLGLYGGPFCRIQELVWPTRRGISLTYALRPLDLTDVSHRSDAQACWHAMAQDMAAMVIGVRDVDYLDWRYRRHPCRHYTLHVLRRRLSGQAVGIFVLGEAVDGRCELLDLIGPLVAMPRLIAAARRMASALGARQLVLWLADCAMPLLDAAAATAIIQELDINVPANAWTAGPPIDETVGKWWLTGGDTDFH